MNLAEMLHDRLTTEPNVSALVSSRVYPRKLPQTPTYPAITYSVISRVATESNTEIFEYRIQLDCWALTYAVSQDLADKALNALRHYRASSGDNRILQTYDANQRDGYDDGLEVYRQIVDILIIFFEG